MVNVTAADRSYEARRIAAAEAVGRIFAAAAPIAPLKVSLEPDAAMLTMKHGTVAVCVEGDTRDLDRIRAAASSGRLCDTSPDALCPVWRARHRGAELIVWSTMTEE